MFPPFCLVINIYKTIVLPVLYGCETWTITLREEHKVFESKELRRIFVPKREAAVRN
jgi:hypothetical protein